MLTYNEPLSLSVCVCVRTLFLQVYHCQVTYIINFKENDISTVRDMKPIHIKI